MARELTSIELRFGETRDTLKLKELSDYLIRVRIVYGVVTEYHSFFEDLVPKDISRTKQAIIKVLFRKNIRAKLKNQTFEDLYKQYYDKTYEKNELILREISYQSPIRIVFYGSVVPLVTAAIISGGKVEAPGFTFDIAPIGVGLQEIRKALEPPPIDHENQEADESEG